MTKARGWIFFKSGRIDDDEYSRYIYQERELVLVVIKVWLILLGIKLELIFIEIKLGLAS